MKKIKVAFAALTAVVGIGGAYATTHQAEANTNRAGTLFTWHTIGNTPVLFNQTVASAQRNGGCPGGTTFCLRGTAPGKTAVTIFKP